MECPYDSDTVDHNHDTAGNLSGCMAGDNRNNSKDSRLWTTTNYVSKSKIIAKAEFVYWPWKVKGMLETAKYD